MATIKINDADKYGNSERAKFFSLEDDGDSALVRILAETMDDIALVAVHDDIQVGSTTRKINCLREPEGEITDCPLCESGYKASVKMYLEVLVYPQDKDGNIGSPTYQIWERGRKYISKIQNLYDRYCKKGKTLQDMVFEIVRNGKKGTTTTTYDILPMIELTEIECPIDWDNIPDKFNPIGTIVLNKSYDELKDYIESSDSAQKRFFSDSDTDDFDKKPSVRARHSDTPNTKIKDSEIMEEDEEIKNPPVGRRGNLSNISTPKTETSQTTTRNLSSRRRPV